MDEQMDGMDESVPLTAQMIKFTTSCKFMHLLDQS